MTEILRTIALSKRFGRNTVLDALELSVSEGSIYGLLGPNGAGKSTALQIAMNIHQPTSGSAEIFGHDSRHISPTDFTRIGYVAENQELPDWMSVEEYMAYLEPFYPPWDAAKASQLVRDFDLPPDRKLGQLSRGMRMKVMLASSLAYRPQLLVLDEPFSGLDSLVRDEVIEGVLANTEGCSMIISSHDLAEIESFCSHIGYLDRGRLQFSEEMACLSERFREIEVTLENRDRISRSTFPPTWLNANQAGSLVRFVETRFEQERTVADVERLFGNAAHVAIKAMPLRSIFVTLAKASRKAA